MRKNIQIILSTILGVFGSVYIASAAFPTSLNNWGSGDTITSSWANSLEATLGITGSAVTTSHDYRISALEAAGYLTSESDPVWTAVSSNYFNLSSNTLDNIQNGTTYKLLTATKESYIDQDVSIGSSPAFLGLTLNSVGYSFPGVDGSSGQCLKTSGAGTLSWGDCSTGSGTGTVATGTASQIAFYESDGTTISGTSTISIVNGKVGIGSTSPASTLVVDDGLTATTTYQIGDSDHGMNKGGFCLWNGSSFTTIYFSGITPVYATSTNCNQ